MGNITLEGFCGPREIQPESMWVGLTRPNQAAKSWATVFKRAREGFQSSEAGIWLPKTSHSEQDLLAAEKTAVAAEAGSLLLTEARHKAALHALSTLAISESGCWQSDIPQGPDTFLDITTIDTARMVLEPHEHIADLRQCDTEGCLYHRHYDVTLDVPSKRRELVYPNTAFYHETDDGVITAWGDRLPAVSESRAKLVAFQQRCAPYVERDDSLLTLGGISQISFIPGTGCWFTRSYYMTPVGLGGYENWQYDGYGRLKIPSKKAREVNYADYAILGHRAVWIVSGNKVKDSKHWVLNHKCGFRPCCNPDHLVEVHTQTNNMHGRMMDVALKMQSGEIPIERGIILLQSGAPAQAINPEDIETFWQNHPSM